jgi:hypothetical protein
LAVFYRLAILPSYSEYAEPEMPTNVGIVMLDEMHHLFMNQQNYGLASA